MSEASTVTNDDIPTLEEKMRNYLAKIHPTARPVRASALRAAMMNECTRLASDFQWAADRVRSIRDLSRAEQRKLILLYNDFPVLQDFLFSLLDA
jgi:hypothetical protein